MTRATPRLRDFAERLISIGATQAESSAATPAAVFAAIEKLRPTLTQVVGNQGFGAFLARALGSAKVDVAWLRSVRARPDGFWDGLERLEDTFDRSEIAEGSLVLLAQFIGLLVELIGERLLLQWVRQAFPEMLGRYFYFGEGNECEKN